MHATLVLMAAGLGSRYGGNKQVDGIGPNGEILMNYGIYDAVRAGFDKVVFIIKPGLEEIVERLCGSQLRAQKVQVEYVYQTYDSIPDWYKIPADRVKPFGTTHAVLCAREAVHEPFAVINADDYYGDTAFKSLYDALVQMPETGRAAMVGYRLKNTLSDTGTVTRGVCHPREDGFLSAVVETYKIGHAPDGTVRDFNFREEGDILDPECLVSMNMWGFTPWIFQKLEESFHAFLKALPEDEIKKESVLPTVVDDLIRSGQMQVQVLSTDSAWFGVTNREDRPVVAAELKKLHESGKYPATLLE